MRHRLVDGQRLMRYAATGITSMLTHIGTLVLLTEGWSADPVVASSTGFCLSIVVSYVLQHRWVFAARTSHGRSVPRFLVVAGIGLALNAGIVALGTHVMGLHYALPQAIALIAVPVSNYVLNGSWTFRDGTAAGCSRARPRGDRPGTAASRAAPRR